VEIMIRPYTDNDLEGVVSCFTLSVRSIAGRHYDAQQVETWAPDSPDMSAWTDRLRRGGVFVAEIDSVIAGFARVEENGYVDLVYVHPDYERRGIGRQLLATAGKWAASRGAQRLESEVSIAARPLFEALGFRVEQEQRVERRGVRFRNYRMSKLLSGRTW
jgi:putative acetyltransferase